MGRVAKNIECEVLVVGGGAAGSMTAINAHDAGADVLIVEKMPTLGGNCRAMVGNILCPTDMKFADYVKALSFKTTDPEVIETFAKEALHNVEWIKKMGGEVIPAPEQGAGYPQAPGSAYLNRYNVKPREGEEFPLAPLWNLLKRNIESRGIRTMTSTPVKELIKNDKGEIVGAIAEHDGERIAIKAQKAVVLTTGGYENDPALKWDNYPCRPITFAGSPGNTGDGVRLAQKVGAAMWHMTNMVSTFAFQAPGYEAAFPLHFHTAEFIFVDKYGRRFMREKGIDVHDYGRGFAYFDTGRLEHPRIPSWAIFTEHLRQVGPLFRGREGYNREFYKWSEDNSAEIGKGWVIQAKNVAELAKKISVEEATLTSTIATYNKYCQAGEDADFGRPKEHLLPIDGPPYCAIQIMPTLWCTQGGPRRDKEARVLDPYGKPIPRLYVAGELGSITGFLYQGGSDIADCIVFSQIAARNAVAEKSL